jgi:hypothetical protein
VAETIVPTFSNSSTSDKSYKAGLWEQRFPLNLLWHSFPSDKTRLLAYRAPSWSWAAVDGAVEFERYIWHAIHLDRIAVKSTTCEIQLASPEAPFGQVIGGHLEIEAPLTELTFRYYSYAEYFDIFDHTSAEMYLDAPRATPNADAGQDTGDIITVSLLCIVREARTHEERNFVHTDWWKTPATRMQGLILEKTSEEIVYIPLGIFRLEWNKSLDERGRRDWKDSFQMTKVTII